MIVYVLLIVAALYIIVGIGFYFPFITRGINKVDDSAAGSTRGFKILILPGVVAFWPILLRKWLKVNKA